MESAEDTFQTKSSRVYAEIRQAITDERLTRIPAKAAAMKAAKEARAKETAERIAALKHVPPVPRPKERKPGALWMRTMGSWR